jgi:intracellular sulfur oxidation DsrE/DsrF family protein
VQRPQDRRHGPGAQDRGVQQSFKGSGNTVKGQPRDEEKAVMPIPVASIVPAGISSTLERQEQGWAHITP